MTIEETKPSGKSVQLSSDTTWEQRILCSDESCTGTIGPDGNCRVCAKPYKGDEPIPTGGDDADTADVEGGTEADDDDTTQTDEFSDDPIDPAPLEATGADWDDRVLCSDESCVGTMGPDGCCRVCGKRSA